VRTWLEKKGLKFRTGTVHETDLTDAQIAQQCRMYIAAARIAADYGCEAIGIQYQQGLKDLCAASDLVEGLLNNVDRPPVQDAQGKILFEGKAVVHFNEVDECAGLDGLITNRIWTKLGFDPETTLHDVRYGELYNGEYVWVFPDLRRSAGKSSPWWICRSGQCPSASDVFPQRRRNPAGHQ
jgi:hypothetical protein